MTFCRRALLWAIAAVLAVATPTVHAASPEATRMLSAELPAGMTLAKANIDQTAAAVKMAVSKKPPMGSSILIAAIQVKMPKQGQGKMSCDDLAKLTRAAMASDSAEASKLAESAASMQPECADVLNALVTNPTSNEFTDPFGPDVTTGFGIGFGPGFPGSPGFVGSAPSGAFALPPVVTTPVTNTLNG